MQISPLIEKIITLFILFFFISNSIQSQDKEKFDREGGIPEGCTTVIVGKKATFDGSVINSHTDDSHRARTNINKIPASKLQPGSTTVLYKRTICDSMAMPADIKVKVGEIPAIDHNYGFINSAYPSMNEKQLAIGESTFGGREELQSDKGLIDCQQLVQLMMERAASAREAISVSGQLLAEYGWSDEGECLTIADKNEAWVFEIVGPGKNKIGAVWAAQRVPDDHISVNANASRIRTIKTDDPDNFLYSENIFSLAQENGWWKPGEKEFEFCYVYAPDSRNSIAARRREWRVLSLAAPSLKLDPNSENYPFSVKPDTLVTLEMMVKIFKDYYENTEYNFVKNITWTNSEGKTEISPLANPFMPYDMNKIFNINGGWGWRGERTIARWYTVYGTIMQSRSWLPDEIGGVVWLAWDNIAAAVYSPVYCSVTDLPESYKINGRESGFNKECAWWAFNRLSTLAAQRWGDMRNDIDKEWGPLQSELFENQYSFEKKALLLFNRDKQAAISLLTDYSIENGEKIVEKAWRLGDFLWTKYDEKF